jgi:Fe2+ or Zn2+ uptake regulation protein
MNHTTGETDRSPIRVALEGAGCRYTRQRAAVYEHLSQAEDHPTAEEVYQAVRSHLPRISLATVYKALESLVQPQLAHKLTNGDGSARYDCRRDEHYHLRDTRTGMVQDLPASYDPHLLQKLDPTLIERLAREGFAVQGYRLEVLGEYRR